MRASKRTLEKLMKIMSRNLFVVWLLCISGCGLDQNKAKNAQQMVYHYSLTVANTNPMVGVQSSLEVEVKYTEQTQQEYAFLYAYSHFEKIIEKNKNVFPHERLVPLNTVKIILTRQQTDTIYQLARRVFMISKQPHPLHPHQPPPPPAHDLDNYLVVQFAPYYYEGPNMQCSGYLEENEAAYSLNNYLKRIEKYHSKK